jgi:hypothetical protein
MKRICLAFASLFAAAIAHAEIGGPVSPWINQGSSATLINQDAKIQNGNLVFSTTTNTKGIVFYDGTVLKSTSVLSATSGSGSPAYMQMEVNASSVQATTTGSWSKVFANTTELTNRNFTVSGLKATYIGTTTYVFDANALLQMQGSVHYTFAVNGATIPRLNAVSGIPLHSLIQLNENDYVEIYAIGSTTGPVQVTTATYISLLSPGGTSTGGGTSDGTGGWTLSSSSTQTYTAANVGVGQSIVAYPLDVLSNKVGSVNVTDYVRIKSTRTDEGVGFLISSSAPWSYTPTSQTGTTGDVTCTMYGSGHTATNLFSCDGNPGVLAYSWFNGAIYVQNPVAASAGTRGEVGINNTIPLGQLDIRSHIRTAPTDYILNITSQSKSVPLFRILGNGQFVMNRTTYSWPNGGEAAGEVLTTDGSGGLTWGPVTSSGTSSGGSDNLGNHLATTSVNMAGFAVYNSSGVTLVGVGNGVVESTNSIELRTGVAVTTVTISTGGVEMPVLTAPGNPPAGFVRFYAKSDGNLYQKDETGTETVLAGGGTGGSSGMQNPATATFNMNGYGIINIASVTFNQAEQPVIYSSQPSFSLAVFTTATPQYLLYRSSFVFASSGTFGGTLTAQQDIVATNRSISYASATVNGVTYNYPAVACSNGELWKYQSGTWTCSSDNNSGGSGGGWLNPATTTLNMGGFGIINLASASFTQAEQPVIYSSQPSFSIAVVTTATPQYILYGSSFVFASSGTFGGNTTVTGTMAATTFSGSGASLTSIPAASISAGSLGSSVLASSVAAGSFQSALSAGSNITLTNTSAGVQIAASGGGSSSSLAVATGTSSGFTGTVSSPTAIINYDATVFTGAPTGGTTAYISLDSDLVDLADGSLTGSKVGSGVPAANIASGSLGASVLASSVAAQSFQAALTAGTNVTLTNTSAGVQIAAGGPTVAAATGTSSGFNGTISTPTTIMLFNSAQFIGAPQGGSTAYYRLDPSSVTLQGTVVSSISVNAFYSNSQVRTNLGLAIGTDVQAFDSDLTDLADGSLTGSKVGDGVPAANIAAGSLDTDVIVSSIAINTVPGTAIQLGSDAQGDVMYYNGTDWVRLGAGTSGQKLETRGAGANPAWDTDETLAITGPLDLLSYPIINVSSITFTMAQAPVIVTTYTTLTYNVATATITFSTMTHETNYFFVSADSTTVGSVTVSTAIGAEFWATAGSTFTFTMYVVAQTSFTAGGFSLGIGCSAVPVLLNYTVEIPIAADGTAADFQGQGTGAGDMILGTSVPAASTNVVARIHGVGILPTTTGAAMKLLFRSEQGTENSIIKVGTHGWWSYLQ